MWSAGPGHSPEELLWNWFVLGIKGCTLVESSYLHNTQGTRMALCQWGVSGRALSVPFQPSLVLCSWAHTVFKMVWFNSTREPLPAVHSDGLSVIALESSTFCLLWWAQPNRYREPPPAIQSDGLSIRTKSVTSECSSASSDSRFLSKCRTMYVSPQNHPLC